MQMYMYPMNAIIFALVLVAVVPRKEILRLSFYGIIFGGALDVLVHLFGNITGLYSWINHGPFVFMGISIFASISWAIFFILYYYFIPKIKPLNYIFMGAAVFFSTWNFNFFVDLGILKTYDRFLVPLGGFTVWFSFATWGFYKLNKFIEDKQKNESTNSATK